MRIIITALIVFVNFILQTTIFPLFAIQGVFPNTSLLIVTSYALLRGSKEGALVGIGAGFLMDVFFNTYIGFYTVLYLAFGLLFGRSQRSFYRENYILPIIFCTISTVIYQAVLYVTGFVFRGEGNILYFLFSVLLPELVYVAIVTVPLYRLLFGINEWLELKEKYKYRLF
ncbi:rod shape-determining protein MreD [Anaerotignum sp.]|nr:rod shape-determining protein MreD [Anaerotignum sp.]MBQ7758759.1 rod shape-determining protein MreD [Anaerotignum sp.]